MRWIPWEEVLKRDDIVGGDLRVQEDVTVYQGPIVSIELKDGRAHIDRLWVAKLNLDTGIWEVCQMPSFRTMAQNDPRDYGGYIEFDMLFRGFGVIFPRGGSKLDPTMVKGLTL